MADNTVSVLKTRAPQDIPDSLDGTILTVVNGDLGNANTSYTYFDLLKMGLNIFSIQFVIQNTTLTIEASNSDPSIDNASAVWSDLTVNLTGAATIVATGSFTTLLPLPWSRFRIKRVTTNATNALTLILTRGRMR